MSEAPTPPSLSLPSTPLIVFSFAASFVIAVAVLRGSGGSKEPHKPADPFSDCPSL
jgi:hypothetical protein